MSAGPADAMAEPPVAASDATDTVRGPVSPQSDREPMPGDSEEMLVAIKHYGGRYFRNPRRLKRWLNGFRLQAYLTRGAVPTPSVDRLARFLVLSEKWPGLVEWFHRHPEVLDSWPQKRSAVRKLLGRRAAYLRMLSVERLAG